MFVFHLHQSVIRANDGPIDPWNCVASLRFQPSPLMVIYVNASLEM